MNTFRRQQTERTPILAFTPNVVANGPVQTMRLYEPIDSWGGPWGMSAKEFTDVLDKLPDETNEIRILINSPGGEVFEGIAILNALRAHKAKTIAVVEGIAASSASFIAAGCDELVMMKNSELYVHNAWGIVMGDAEVMRSVADDLEHFDRNIASIYAEKSGDDVEYWLGQMGSNTFLSAEEAVAAKLADRVEGVGDSAAAKARFDLSVFAHAPRVGVDPISPEPPSSSEPVDHQNTKEIAMSDTLKAGILERLGLTDAAASDESLLAALDGALETPTDTPEVPEGTTLIDSEVLAGLQSDAAQGRAAREEQIAARRDGIVNQALKEGRIAPTASAAWRAQLDVDEEGTTALIALLAANTAVPVDELGHQPADASGDDALYYSLFSDEQPNKKEA